MSDWTNNKELNIRQKLALRLIILAIGLLEPYQFSHQFDKEFDDIKKLISTPSTPTQRKDK